MRKKKLYCVIKYVKKINKNYYLFPWDFEKIFLNFNKISPPYNSLIISFIISAVIVKKHIQGNIYSKFNALFFFCLNIIRR